MRSLRLALAAVLAAALLAACGDDSANRDASGQLTSAGSITVFDLQEGDCAVLDEDVQAEVHNVHATPCAEPHQLEVYAVVDYTEGSTYPGPDVLTEFAESTCATHFADYVGSDYLDSSLFFTYLYPTLRSWDEGDDRAVICFASTTGELITGSVEGSGR